MLLTVILEPQVLVLEPQVLDKNTVDLYTTLPCEIILLISSVKIIIFSLLLIESFQHEVILNSGRHISRNVCLSAVTCLHTSCR